MAFHFLLAVVAGNEVDEIMAHVRHESGDQGVVSESFKQTHSEVAVHELVVGLEDIAEVAVDVDMVELREETRHDLHLCHTVEAGLDGDALDTGGGFTQETNGAAERVPDLVFCHLIGSEEDIHRVVIDIIEKYSE